MKTRKPEVSNCIAAVRQQRGLSAAGLAKAVGISRQTIYAVEAGSYIPNTAIGLRLAQTLGVSLDNLFSLTIPPPALKRTERATMLSPDEKFESGQPVQLCRVNGKLIAMEAGADTWCLPLSDGLIADSNTVGGSARIQVTAPNDELDERILLAGCDPAMGILRRHLQAAGIDVLLAHRNSSQSLSLLKTGVAHIAGSHLASNANAIRKMFSSKPVELISFAIWREGLLASPGNPKSVKGVEDLARKDVTVVNREPGSGSRALLDRHLQALPLPTTRVRGYAHSVSGHMAAASEVKAGAADCCISTEAAAHFFGLTFIPLETVRYDLAVRKQHLSESMVQRFFDSISHLAFRKKLGSWPGYDTSVTGDRVGNSLGAKTSE